MKDDTVRVSVKEALMLFNILICTDASSTKRHVVCVSLTQTRACARWSSTGGSVSGSSWFKSKRKICGDKVPYLCRGRGRIRRTRRRQEDEAA